MAIDILEKRREQMFPKLTPAQLSRLEARSTYRKTKAGEILLDVGARPAGLFIVIAGSVEVLTPNSDVRTKTCDYTLLNVLTAGDFSGEMSALRDTPGLARLRVGEQGMVLQLGLDQLRHVVQNDPELSELMMRAFILRRLGIVQSGSSETTVLGSSHAGDTLRIREFLTRNARPYVDIDVDHDPDAQALLERFHIQPQDLPVVVCRGGEVFRNPGNRAIAECLGINSQPDDTGVHDVIIIGAGPAGLAAAVYAASEGLDVRIVDSFAPGGQAGTSSRIENYLGFPTGISGGALAGRALSQAQKFGAQLSVAWQAVRLHCDNWPYTVEMSDGTPLRGRIIVIASGAQYRTLDVANEQRFLGSGVYYAATHLEARLCGGEDVAIVGGGNSAGQAAVFLAGSCRHVHVLVRAAGLAESMSAYLINRIEDAHNITLHTRTQITALDGADRLERVWMTGGGPPEEWELHHLFLMTGASPNTRWLAGCVALDAHGFVKTGPDLARDELSRWHLPRPPYLLESSVPGVFAAGDVRAGSVKRIASAVGEGSVTVQFAHRALRDLGQAASRESVQ